MNLSVPVRAQTATNQRPLGERRTVTLYVVRNYAQPCILQVGSRSETRIPGWSSSNRATSRHFPLTGTVPFIAEDEPKDFSGRIIIIISLAHFHATFHRLWPQCVPRIEILMIYVTIRNNYLKIILLSAQFWVDSQL